jgi:hypothetical protein
MKNSGPLFGLAFLVFAGTLAVTIGSSLSEQTMTMLTGAVCGAGLTAPFAILAGVYIGSQRAARDQQSKQPQQPVIVVTPPTQPSHTMPALPAWNNYQPAGIGLAMPEPRHYTILGEETVIDGTSNFRQ